MEYVQKIFVWSPQNYQLMYTHLLIKYSENMI